MKTQAQMRMASLDLSWRIAKNQTISYRRLLALRLGAKQSQRPAKVW